MVGIWCIILIHLLPVCLQVLPRSLSELITRGRLRVAARKTGMAQLYLAPVPAEGGEGGSDASLDSSAEAAVVMVNADLSEQKWNRILKGHLAAQVRVSTNIDEFAPKLMMIGTQDLKQLTYVPGGDGGRGGGKLVFQQQGRGSEPPVRADCSSAAEQHSELIQVGERCMCDSDVYEHVVGLSLCVGAVVLRDNNNTSSCRPQGVLQVLELLAGKVEALLKYRAEQSASSGRRKSPGLVRQEKGKARFAEGRAAMRVATRSNDIPVPAYVTKY